ncbi:MAG: hypothetical protein ABI347_10500 [Nitrososphaera sp.]|jgi:hypothetical protein
MKAIINRHMFTQGNVDSGTITMMSTVVHRFSEPGEYKGRAIRGGNVVGNFTIIVGKREMSSSGQPTQAQIDLRQVEMPAAGRAGDGLMPNRFNIGADGYAVFRTSAAGGYVVEVYQEDGGQKVFDSCELKDGDLFYVMVLRPGTYSVTNTITNARAELTVAYPEKGMARNSEPVRIECSGKGGIISPDKISIKPMQGMVFNCKVPSRLKIDLVRPEDRAPVTPAAAAKETAQQQQQMMQAKAKPPSGKKIRRRIRIMPRTTLQA